MTHAKVVAMQIIVTLVGLFAAMQWFDRIRCPEIHGQAMCVLFDHQADKAAAFKKVLMEMPKGLK